MKIAVTYENGNVFQHFGHTEQFKVYEVENGEVRDTGRWQGFCQEKRWTCSSAAVLAAERRQLWLRRGLSCLAV